MRSATGACDALSDGTCPSADLCARDSALSGVKNAQLAKDDAVTEFWGKREEVNQRRREAKLSDTKLSSTTVGAPASRLSNSGPASGHKSTGSSAPTSGSNTRGMR